MALDADALRRLGGANAWAKVPLDDLRKVGWTVERADRSVTLAHEFAGPDDLAMRLADLVGPSRLLRDPRIGRTRSWFRDRDSLSIIVDLRDVSASVERDTTLVTRLRAAGVDVGRLSRQLDAQLRDALHVRVALRLPDGTSTRMDVQTGDTRTVRARAASMHAGRVAGIGIAVALMVLALALLVFARRGARMTR